MAPVRAIRVHPSKYFTSLRVLTTVSIDNVTRSQRTHLRGKPLDSHILSAALEQATNLMQDIPAKINQVVVGLGFRAVETDSPGKSIIHRGRLKSLSPQQRGWLRRRHAIEPAIGHLKADHRMDRCWLQGAPGDALHATSCAAGYKLRWLLRAIVRLRIRAVFLRLWHATLSVLLAVRTSNGAHNRTGICV